MRFVCIDFETANSSRKSACALGAVVVEDLSIIETRSWLIRPPRMHFSYQNFQIHGITAEDVKDKPKFDVLWQEIVELFGDTPIVAHNANFDMNVLANLLHYYNLDVLPNDTSCTYLLSKKAFSELPNHRLDTVAEHLNIEMDRHHEAQSDAIACAEMAINICKQYQEHNPVSLSAKLGVTCKTVANYYQSVLEKKKNNSNNWPETIRISEINPQSESFDKSHPFFAKKVVLTGTIDGMERRDAMQAIVDVGGLCTTSVSRMTHFLVVGKQTSHNLTHETKSSKQLKVELLISQGFPIQIMTSQEFTALIGNDIPF